MTVLDWPRIALTGAAITFAPRLTEPANRATLSLRGVVEAAGWSESRETAASPG